MVTLTLSDVNKLKTIIKNQFDTTVHFHDCCGGQYFSIDKPTEELKEFIAAFFVEKKLNVIFSENGRQFSIEEISQC